MKKNQRVITKRPFTITEVMMVIAICILVLSITVIAWINPGKLANLKNAASLVCNQLNLARVKATSERKAVGVYFNVENGKSNHFAMLVCYEGDKDHQLTGEHWVNLPSSIIFTTTKPTAAAQTMQWPAADADRRIIFRHDGSLATDSADDLMTFYLVPADQSNNQKDDAETHYYQIQLNEFTGRYKITLHEIE